MPRHERQRGDTRVTTGAGPIRPSTTAAAMAVPMTRSSMPASRATAPGTDAHAAAAAGRRPAPLQPAQPDEPGQQDGLGETMLP